MTLWTSSFPILSMELHLCCSPLRTRVLRSSRCLSPWSFIGWTALCGMNPRPLMEKHLKRVVHWDHYSSCSCVYSSASEWRHGIKSSFKSHIQSRSGQRKLPFLSKTSPERNCRLVAFHLAGGQPSVNAQKSFLTCWVGSLTILT